jgi:hypothetical protein
MVRKYLIAALVLTAIFSAVQKSSAQQVLPRLNSGRYFEVGIEQNGKSVPIENHQVTLQKIPFSLVFYFPRQEGILVNTSFTPESFEPARNGQPFDDIPGFSDLGMAEEPFNPRVVVMITSRAPHFWYYANQAEHRFNEVSKDNGIFICRRIVANVMYRDTTKEIVALRNIPEDTLYLVFMKTVWTKDYSQQIEQQREYLKITFQ